MLDEVNLTLVALFGVAACVSIVVVSCLLRSIVSLCLSYVSRAQAPTASCDAVSSASAGVAGQHVGLQGQL